MALLLIIRFLCYFGPYKSSSLFPEILSLTKAGFGLHGLLIFTVGISAEEKLALSFNITDWLNIKLGGSLRIWSFDAGDELYDEILTYSLLKVLKVKVPISSRASLPALIL